MKEHVQDLVFTDTDDQWFFQKYYADGSNSRFYTFQLAMNMLVQRDKPPVIVETGCQRQEDDLGAGMSTSIFAEYIARYGGELHVVDNNVYHLSVAEKCIAPWAPQNMNKVYTYHNDSAVFLQEWMGEIDLLYLDSWDYPIFEMAKAYDPDFDTAMEIMKKIPHEELQKKFADIVYPCQEHTVREFKAVEDQLNDNSIVLIDDNRLPGGGKPGLLKPILVEEGWKCLFDLQQSLWVREL